MTCFLFFYTETRKTYCLLLEFGYKAVFRKVAGSQLNTVISYYTN